MNILFVNPQTPATFWSFRHAVKFVSKKSTEPPLNLITIAAMLPKLWSKKLIDINVSDLKDEHILWEKCKKILFVHTKHGKKQ